MHGPCPLTVREYVHVDCLAFAITFRTDRRYVVALCVLALCYSAHVTLHETMAPATHSLRTFLQQVPHKQ